MNKKLVLTSVVLALVIALAAVGIASAQSQPPGNGGWGGNGPRGGMMGGFGNRGSQGGMMGGYMGDGNRAIMHDAMFNALAEGLGLTRAELDERVEAGETPLQIATAQGLTQDEAVQLLTVARQSALSQAVADGLITQEQAEAMLARMAGRAGGNCPHLNGTAPTN